MTESFWPWGNIYIHASSELSDGILEYRRVRYYGAQSERRCDVIFTIILRSMEASAKKGDAISMTI